MVTEFILENVTLESFCEMIKERFSEAVDMNDDLKFQRHHTLSIAYNKEMHDELAKRLWNAPLEITIKDDRLVIELIAGTDPEILCNAIDNWYSPNLTITK